MKARASRLGSIEKPPYRCGDSFIGERLKIHAVQKSTSCHKRDERLHVDSFSDVFIFRRPEFSKQKDCRKGKGMKIRQYLHLLLAATFLLASSQLVCAHPNLVRKSADILAGIVLSSPQGNYIQSDSVELVKGPLLYEAPDILDVGSGPRSVTRADLDRDGRLDIITAESGDNTVSVFFGRGDGTFESRQSFGVGAGPSAVAVGDFNNDSLPDVVTAHFNSNTITVLFGNGGGDFGAPVIRFVGTRPRHLAVGDFDGNGADDIVTLSSSDVALSVNYGFNVEGGLSGSFNYFVGTIPRCVTAADVNGDGDDEIITGYLALDPDNPSLNGVPFVSVLNIRNSSRTVLSNTSFEIRSDPVDVAAGDVDGDGDIDIVAASNLFYTVLQGNGSGEFARASDFNAERSLESIILADANNDRALDIIAANDDADAISIYPGKGDGSFAQARFFRVGDSPRSVTSGDFNQDKRLDIITADAFDNTLTLLQGRTDGTYAVGISPRALIARDVDGDGGVDFTVTENNDNTVSVLLREDDGNYGLFSSSDTGSSPWGLAAGDLNRDGHVDFVTSNFFVGSISVLLGKGDGTFEDAVDYTAIDFAFTIAIEDMNNDGNLDIVVGSGSGSSLAVFLGKGDGTFDNVIFNDIGRSILFLSVGDLNSDGIHDLVSISGGDENIAVNLGRGDGSFEDTETTFAGGSSGPFTAGDLDHDGNLDVVVNVSFEGGASFLSVLTGDGLGSFSEPKSFPIEALTSSMNSGDMNGDGMLDIITINNNDTVTVFLGQGDGTLAEGQIFAQGDFTAFGTTADIDGDADLDVVIVNRVSDGIGTLDNTLNWDSDNISVLENTLDPDCSATVLINGETLSPLGGSGSAAVDVPYAVCPWSSSIAGTPAWFTFESGEYLGDKSIAFQAEANPLPFERSVSFSVAGQDFTVTQSANPNPDCSIDVLADRASFTEQGGSSALRIATTFDVCDWDIIDATLPSWISITPPTAGKGNSIVDFTVSPNPQPSSRSGAIDVSGRQVTITQDANPDSTACSFTLRGNSAFPFQEGSGSFRIQSEPELCRWEVSSNLPSWISIDSATAGSGSAFVEFSIGENTQPFQRSGTINVSGRQFTIKQEGNPDSSLCSTTVTNVSTRNFSDGGGDSTVSITSNYDICSWTFPRSALPGWIDLNSPSTGSGSAQISLRIRPNFSTLPRSENISLFNSNTLIEQSGVPCVIQASFERLAFAGIGGGGTLNIETNGPNCPWEVTYDSAANPWLQFLGQPSGSDDKSIEYSIARNPMSGSRFAVISVTGSQDRTVLQEGDGFIECENAVFDPADIAFSEDGGTFSTQVSFEAGEGGGCQPIFNGAQLPAWVTWDKGLDETSQILLEFHVAGNNAVRERRAEFFIAERKAVLRQSGRYGVSDETGVSGALYGLHGKADGEIAAVGESGLLLLSKSGKWEREQTQTSEDLRDVWGDDNDTLYIVGSGGFVATRSGNNLQSQSLGAGITLHAIWGDENGRLFTVGEDGALFVNESGVWQSHTSAAGKDLYDVVGDSNGNIWACGEDGTLLRSTGSSWTLIRGGPDTDLLAATTDRNGRVALAGADGNVHIYDGSAWSAEAAGFQDPVSIYSGEGNRFYIGARDGSVHQGVNGTYTRTLPPESFRANAFTIFDTSDFYAVGEDGKVMKLLVPEAPDPNRVPQSIIMSPVYYTIFK
jgi:hypothetical protein